MIDIDHAIISLRRQCELLSLARSNLYYHPAQESEYNLQIMNAIDELYMKYPVYGSRRMTVMLNRDDYQVNRKRVQRLMRLMGLEAIYQKPRTSIPDSEHQVYPYLLRNQIGRAHV